MASSPGAPLDALRKGDSNGNGTIELSELVRHVQSVVPKIAAELGGKARAATAEPVFGKQHVRSGLRGADFAVAHRLHQPPWISKAGKGRCCRKTA
jgi:hypothetical protein